MTEKGDRRMNGQEDYLVGCTLKLTRYVRCSERNGHEHCEFRWEKISEYGCLTERA